MMTDSERAARLLKAIAANLKEQRRLTLAIERLAAQRLARENQERELRARLREVWTEPLNFGE